jgi:hypothetical protein
VKYLLCYANVPAVSHAIVLMTSLESPKSPLARAYPLILGSIEEVECYAADGQRPGMTEDNIVVVIDNCAGQMIRPFTLDCPYNLLELVYVLSPRGDATAKLPHRHHPRLSTMANKPSEIPWFSMISSSNWQIMKMVKPMRQ